ncbi:hypothetical protein BC828DRAFT_401827 [Blastocladiella britannica]|nr:hypothetical protein BC828DRAFT_401827 [Blastocladiella britannica]
MDDLLASHRKETKALQGQLTALRKQAQANKKLKKELTAQMESLEADLTARHAREVAELTAQLAALPTTDTDATDDTAPVTATGPADAADAVDAEADLAEATTTGTASGSGKGAKKPNRQHLRKARKQAEIEALQEQARAEAANMPDRAAMERKRLDELLARHKLKVYSIPADGHCLFNSIAHQLKTDSDGVEDLTYQSLRSLAGQYIILHQDDFAPFLLNEETGDLMTPREIEKYVDLIVHTPYWGGHIEIKALAYALSRCIHVYQPGSIDPLLIGSEFESPNCQPLRVCYVQHQFGLGEHYNSLIPFPL